MGNAKKVLIVDDEPDFLLALQRTMEAKQYQVTTASNKAEAQERIKKEGSRSLVSYRHNKVS